ncbi:class I SAM-dependent methyltransferase [Gracilibacillus xinjiangensis]|uniref:Class I SAM-dependent methyltransferase n=1 Tax=Gracilibacillus xinjiangensis TaxID=1193282 RepID=A0ABV8WVL0_9BACI
MPSYMELLNQLGMSHAHPGGKTATSKWMELISVTNKKNILEVGCGIGETLLTIHEKSKANITGIDINQQMIKKAQQKTEAIPAVHVLKADAETLPFENEQFDLVICESVLAFTNLANSLKEVSRVLMKNGTVVLLEMAANPKLDNLDKTIIQNFYDIPQLFTRFEWLKYLLDTGFNKVMIQKVCKHNEDSLPENKQIQWTDQMLETLGKHYQLNQQYGDSLHACLFIASKARDDK